tara:strand:+ start:1649 stop:1975 length:327 start_codon:yes stop_codon:yes gene_type:complete
VKKSSQILCEFFFTLDKQFFEDTSVVFQYSRVQPKEEKMVKWILTFIVGVMALAYVAYASFYDAGTLKAITLLSLFVVAFGMTLSLSLMERPTGRKTHDVSKGNFHLR